MSKTFKLDTSKLLSCEGQVSLTAMIANAKVNKSIGE